MNQAARLSTTIPKPLCALILFVLAVLGGGVAAQPLQPGARHMQVSLAAETRGAGADSVLLSLDMRPEPGWHGYWKNPGDAGVETRVAWQLPAGWHAEPLQYPVPQRLNVAGLMNYVYERDFALLARVRLPAGTPPGPATVRAKVDYLVCTDKICVPESAEVASVVNVSPPAATAAFDARRAALPRPLGSEARFEKKAEALRIGIPLPESVAVDDPYFFPLTDGAIDYAAPQRVSRNGPWLIVETKAGAGSPTAVEGVLAMGGGQGLSLTARPGTVPAAGAALGGEGPAPETGARAILLALGGALLGGLLLNIMPCVFPILSLKALGLARSGGGEREARREAVAYAAGVVLACVALGGTLLAVRAGGAAVGWAFQLQDPRVTLLLLVLMVAITLNLAGLFELPGFGGGERLASKHGAAGAFWAGALAAFVATPCTGPFMGAALGAALVLPAAAALAVFAGLGLGLALPFLALGFIPRLRRLLPKPGAWMNRFRHILAVPMAVTAFWLGWLLWRQGGAGALAVGIAAAAVVGAALWWAGRQGRWRALVPSIALAAAALFLLPTRGAPAAGAAGDILASEAFSEARLAQLRAEGRPVFVYFTADWCLTCKVNEQAVLGRGEVAEAFKRGGVAVLVGDWTRGDAAIGRFLEKQGRSGVPLYLWYPPGKPAAILPQILTVGSVAGLDR